MTTKPRRPLGERPVRVEVSEKLVKVRQHTLALSAFTDIDGPLPTELFDDEPVSGSITFEEITCVGLTPAPTRSPSTTPRARARSTTRSTS